MVIVVLLEVLLHPVINQTCFSPNPILVMTAAFMLAFSHASMTNNLLTVCLQCSNNVFQACPTSASNNQHNSVPKFRLERHCLSMRDHRVKKGLRRVESVKGM
eukprot:5266615-Ditylum_brightwellii.AAC.1